MSQETGQPIGTGMAFVRDICHFVDGIICDIGYLWPLWDDKRQTLADKIVKTVVIPALRTLTTTGPRRSGRGPVVVPDHVVHRSAAGGIARQLS